MKNSFTSLLIGLLLLFVAFFAVTVQADDNPHFVATGVCCASIPITAHAGAHEVFIIASWHDLSALDKFTEIAALEPISTPHALAIATLQPGIIPNTQGNPPGTNYGSPLHQLLG